MGAIIGQPGGDDIFRQIARGVRRRSIDLAGILARKGTTAVRRGTAIGIDNNLATGQSGVAIGAANHEPPGRIDVELGLLAHPAVGQDVDHVRPNNLANRFLIEILTMLGRHHHRRRADWFAVDVAQRHLAFRVWTQAGLGAGMTRPSQRPARSRG